MEKVKDMDVEISNYHLTKITEKNLLLVYWFMILNKDGVLYVMTNMSKIDGGIKHNLIN